MNARAILMPWLFGFIAFACYLALAGCEPYKPGPYDNRHHSARVCAAYCRANGMRVASWDGRWPDRDRPSSGCRCGERR